MVPKLFEPLKFDCIVLKYGDTFYERRTVQTIDVKINIIEKVCPSRAITYQKKKKKKGEKNNKKNCSFKFSGFGQLSLISDPQNLDAYLHHYVG